MRIPTALLLAPAFLLLLGCGDEGPSDGPPIAWGPNHGVMVSVGDGWAEVKLHDDKGDLEVWLSRDKDGATPWDLPLGTTLRATASEPAHAPVTLAVRDTDQNPDEDGNATVRDGKTNYFIFPGNSGADATWLMGADFTGTFTVTVGGATSDSFTLIPHTHAGGHGHGHGHGHDDGDEHGHDGDSHEDGRRLGHMEMGGVKVEVTLYGAVEAGKEAHFDVVIEVGEGAEAPIAVRAWIGIETGKGSLKTKLSGTTGTLHGHAEVPAEIPEGAGLWVELEAEGGQRAKLTFPY